jgi:molybdopterin-guanine dinucleotide biosynthesis protein A
MTLAVIILAGGAGSRMGGNKPLRVLAGKTLLARAIETARSWSNEVAIAVRRTDEVEARDVCLLCDPPGLEGPLAGLASALRLGKEMVLTIPCDAPLLPDDLPERLAAALPGHAAALASSGGQVHPVCGLWRLDALAQVRGYAASGRRSLIGFAERVGFVPVEWPSEPVDPFFNINSPEDLAAAERLLRG